MVSDIMVTDHSDSDHHMGYYFRLAARVLLYAPSHRQDSTYHSLCYTSREALAGTRNCLVGLHLHPVKDRFDYPSHPESTFYNGATSCSNINLKNPMKPRGGTIGLFLPASLPRLLYIYIHFLKVVIHMCVTFSDTHSAGVIDIRYVFDLFYYFFFLC